MRERLLAIIKKKEDRMKEIENKVDTSKEEQEVIALTKEYRSIEKEIGDLRSTVDEMEAAEQRAVGTDGENEELEARTQTQPQGPFNPIDSYRGTETQTENRTAELEKRYDQRGKDLKEKRAVTFDISEIPELRVVTIGGGSLVVEKKYSKELNPKFNEVSSLIDRVNAIPLDGGESYAKGFEVSTGEGAYTEEQGNYGDAEPVFDYVTIGKAKITAYAEMTDESMKLPNVQYQSMVARSIGEALRKKITRQILVGPGGANALTGIFNAPINVIPADTDIEVAEINADTLDKIIFGYGGDEEIEGGAVLVLNKKDLAAFAAIRSTDGKKLYKIKKSGNTGTISSDDSFEVPFIINSACPALSADATNADTYCMAYGMAKAYEMPVFSPVSVEESREFKFRTGQIAYRGSVWAGGNVAMHKGFVRVKKVAAT